MSPSRAGSSIGETGKPVEARDHPGRSIRGSAARSLPAWAGEGLIRTDAEGKFRLEFPAEQVAEPRLCIAMQIRHPGFTPEVEQVALADLIRGQARGEEPFFAKLTLERGVEYTGQVVVPGGKPAAGFHVFENGTSRTSYPSLSSRTITRGRPTTAAASACGCRRPRRWPSSWVPRARTGAPISFRSLSTLLGYRDRLQAPGCLGPHRPRPDGAVVRYRLPGRLFNTEDRPIAGQTITAYPLRGHDRHSTTTEADGSFTLARSAPRIT